MNGYLSLVASVVPLATALALAAENSAPVVGSDAQVLFVEEDAKLLFDLQTAATAFGWQAKIVTPDKLATLCRDEQGGSCIPLRLDTIGTHIAEGRTFIDAAVLAQALDFVVTRENGKVLIVPDSTAAETKVQVTAYHAAWGTDRGFGVGQTLPDIPLYDMAGREVRFSQFLGKKYILYCWASW